jgi:hypothetical protein
MFRLFAVLLVVGAFVGALYFSGDALEAWEKPKQEAVAVPKLPKQKKQAEQKRRARPARPTQPVKSVSHAKPSWLVALNAACRQGKRESEAIPRPTTPQELPRMLKQAIRVNARWNRKTAEVVSRSGNATASAQLRSLYAQDEALLQRVLTAAEQGRYQRLPKLGRSLIALARAENNLFARIGAGACTVSPDELQL